MVGPAERESSQKQPKTISQLLEDMPSPEFYVEKSRELQFVLAETQASEDLDVYNITAPFLYRGERYIAGRTERHDDEVSSQTRFYKHRQADNTWVQDETMPILGLQDPFVTRLDDKWVVGGVYVSPKKDGSRGLDWETHIRIIDDLKNLEPNPDYDQIIKGPPGMKDIRLLQLQSGKILVATRPQGEKGGLGKMGATSINNISELKTGLMQDAPIIDDLFASEFGEWGGANELYELNDGTIGVLGHIARRDEGDNREYYAMTCRLDPVSLTAWDEKIIASSDYWPNHRYKRPELQKVHFPGGMIIDGELAKLYGGVGDASPGEVQDLPNPFWPAVPLNWSLYV